VGQLTS